METATREPEENAMRKVEKRKISARKCGNPDCGAVWKDKNVTICLKCGWGTRQVED